MSAKLSSLRKRLVKLEQEHADRVRREELENCNCPELKSDGSFLAVWPEALEAEMNETCPVHGLRRFGEIVIMDCVKPDGTESENTMKMCQLIDSHERRLAQHSQSSVEPEEENDSQES
jgi:hypothetical protein